MSSDTPHTSTHHLTSLTASESSSLIQTLDSTAYLSTAIQTKQFIESRHREIILLEKGIKAKPSVYNKHGMRLFQILPRYMRRRQMSHNLHLMPSYLRKRAAFEYSNTVTKRKKRKIKRWKRHKMVSQLEVSDERDPVDQLYSGNSMQMREFLQAMRDLRSGAFDLESVMEWESLGGKIEKVHVDDMEVDQEGDKVVQSKSTNPPPPQILRAHPSIVASINDSISRIEVHNDEPLPKPKKLSKKEKKAAKKAKEALKDAPASEQNTPKPRKEKARKPTDILFGPKRSINHVFLVKRSHLRPMWGNLVAWSAADKIFRVTHKFYKTHCTVSDNSFYVTLQVSGNVAQIVELLNTFARQRVQDKPHLEAFLEGRRREVISMWDRKLEASYGDVDVLFASASTSEAVAVHHLEQRPVAEEDGDEEHTTTTTDHYTEEHTTTENSTHTPDEAFRTCLLWLHPASLPHAFYRLREECQMRNLHIQYRSDLCRFVMRGPHVSTVLCRNNVLSVPLTHNHPDKIKLWQQFKEDKNVVAPHGLALSLKIRHPQFPDTALSMAEAGEVVASYASSVTTPARAFTQEELTTYTRTTITSGTDNLWKNNFFEKFDQKHDDATYNNKTTTKVQRKRIQEMSTLTDTTDSSSKWFSTYFDIVLLKHQTGDSFGAGWDIICPREVAASLFYKLGKTHHVLLVPLVDQLRMQTEQAQMNFPFDYPDAHAFYTLQNEDFDKMVYKKHHVKLGWAEIFQACGVKEGERLQFVGRSEANDESLRHAVANMSAEGTTTFRAVNVDFSFGQTPVRKGQLLLPRNAEHLKQIIEDPNRALPHSADLRTVGFITSATQSLQRGYGFGVGYVVEEVCGSLGKGQFTVLLYWDPENSRDCVYAVKCSVQQ